MQCISFFRKHTATAVIGIVLFFSACSPTKNLKDGQYFFTGYDIKQDNNSISKEDLDPYIRQKPNRKFFFLFRLQMGFYNFGSLGDTTVSGTKFLNHFWKITKRGMRIIGEEPVVLDTGLVHHSTNQLKFFMDRKGYFNSVAKDTIIYKKKKAKVIYSIQSGIPYRIKTIQYTSKDTAVYSRLIEEQKNSLIRPGMIYDEEILDRERERFTDVMKSRGYYFFTKQFISYSADSSLQSNEMDLRMNVSRQKEDTSENNSKNHYQYYLNRIFVSTDYDPKSIVVGPYDTVIYKNYFFLVNRAHPEQRYRRDVLLRAIFIAHGDLFNINDVKYSYSRLTDLNVFRFVNIRFTEVPRTDAQSEHLLDVNILLTPLYNQDFTVETQVTNNGGDLGIAGNFSYRNKNTFNGAELLELKLKGGIEAQKTFSTDENRLFNTYEIGPEADLNIKRLLFIDRLFRYSLRKWNPYTRISIAANYQQRPDYNRSIGNTNFSWKIKTTPAFQLAWDLFDINFVNVQLSPSFVNKLNLINDKGLFYNYSDHLITSGRFSYILNTQSTSSTRNYDFLQLYPEFSGFLLSLIKSAPYIKDDTLGFRKAFGLNYSQYVKGEVDYRHYQNLTTNNILVLRADIGIGRPIKNSIALPFEKSFYGGGANSMRAWRFRSLGPGSYVNEFNIEQTGDIKIEFNGEIRSPLVRRFSGFAMEGAIFADAGNIWLWNPDPERVGGDFGKFGLPTLLHKTLPELALGGGLGIRFNFSYFIFRVDAAVKLLDPSLPEAKQWVYGAQKFAGRDITYNFGIGYPF